MRKRAQAEPKSGVTEAQGTSLLPIITVILGVMTGLQVLIFVLHAYRTLTFPYQLDYGEGPILQIAVRVARGEAMYPPIDQPPYVIASYEPLYYLLCALGVKITGPGFLFGRLVSLVSTLAVALCAALIVWRATKHRVACCLAAGLILSMPHVMVWSTLMRIDLPAIGLAVVGFCLFTAEHRVSGIPLFALGVFTRRTNVAAMGAAFVGDAEKRGWRPAVRAFAVQAALIVLLMGGAVLVTRGGMYHQLAVHTASSLGKAWSWQQLWSLIWYPLLAYPAYFAITVLGAIWCAVRRERRLLFVYFAFACVIFLTGGRIGSAHNYLVEPMVMGAMMFGMMWADLSRRGPGLPAAALMAIGGALAIQMVWTDSGGHLSYSISLSQEEANAGASEYVVARIRETPGEALCQDTGLAVLAGKPEALMPFEFTQIARRRALDPTPVFRKVREGGYPLIIMRFNPFDPHEQELHRPGEDWRAGRWPDGLIDGVMASYRLEQKVGPFFIFVPKA
jgi:hypothetical protein